MPFFDKVVEILSGGAVKAILDKIPDPGSRAQAALELEKENHRAAEAIAELAAKENEIAQTNLTERAKNDMLSDSWLSKNIRPMALIFLLVVVSSLAVLDSVETVLMKVDEAWIEMFKVLLLAAFSYYFIGRTFEKIKLS
jgi:hypothetical protein